MPQQKTPLPFRIDVSDQTLDDLRDRLHNTRFSLTETPGDSGISPDHLREIVDHWLHRYHWREHEARLNRYPQFTIDVGGDTVHFVHIRSLNPRARAIVLSHGWPYSFAEMLPLADVLTEFDVVVPSLPGYAFSSLPASGPVTKPGIAETWHELMTSVLGYDSYLTYGEDVGAGVSDWLAAAHPEAVDGIFATHAAFTPDSRRVGESHAETEFFEWFAAKWTRSFGYSAIQATRPDTLAASLNDSPAGLAAWMIEKLDAWSDDGSLTLDSQLTTVMLYWISGCIGSSFRAYYDSSPLPELPVITVPAAVAVQVGESKYPREMAERNYLDLRGFSHLERGGHFTAAEAPDLLAQDIRRFVATLEE